jgi:redox-sensitive bicupin YhaK (pirin superfamily)
MPLHIRKSQARGHFDHGWLDTYHTFSFSDYYDPKHMGFRSLRVINEDRVAAGEGFGTHPHNDMEIVTYVLEGELEHKDSMGNGSVIRPGEVQYMSAGTGVTHSEFNASSDKTVHLLQIWILPDKRGYEPRYGQKSYADALASGKLTLVASSDGREGSIAVRQDMNLFVARLKTGSSVSYDLAPKRVAWLQVARGAVELNGQALNAGDGAAASETKLLEIKTGDSTAEVLLFDLS